MKSVQRFVGGINKIDGDSMKNMTVLLMIILFVVSISFISVPSEAIGYSRNTDLSIMGASYVGQSPDDHAGFSVAGVGDVNGDGYDDIIIGAPSRGEWDEGQVYLIFGKSSGWTPDMNLAEADASFFGEHIFSDAGFSVAAAGDVNGDGFDDMIIGARGNDGRGFNAGQAYLIFGKSSGWAMGTSLSNVDASYIGVGIDDEAGFCVSGSGDINNDGFDDVIISARKNDDNGPYSGQTYVIFGNNTGWSKDNTLSNADASFIGESANDSSGKSIAILGDVNGDGYDDILIGASGNDDSGGEAGKSYLIFGNASGWEKNTNLASVNVTFLGEYAFDYSGYSVAAAGDINGDNLDDILIGAYKNDEAGEDAGQTYIIFGKTSGWGEDVNLSNADASFLGEAAGDLSGCSLSSAGDVDGDGFDDILIGAWREDQSDLVYLIMGNASGWSMDMNLSDADASFLGEGGRISIHSLSSAGDFNDDGYDDILIGHPYHELDSSYKGKVYLIFPKLNYTPPMTLYPLQDNPTAAEDEQYNAHYWSVNATADTWVFETNAGWLEWNETTHDIYGIPDNTDVGSFWVRINISNETSGYDEHNFTLNVLNTPLEIITGDTTYAYEDSEYLVDYDSDDDGQGMITWYVSTNASWLSFNSITGIINGTPINEQVGVYYVNISVEDGNGGWDSSNFTLDVLNTNDPPEWIDTPTNTLIRMGDSYEFDINAFDEDLFDRMEYRLIQISTLSGNTYSASLNETSGLFEFSSESVGLYQVKIGATDQSIMIYHDFQIDVRSPSENLPPSTSLTYPKDTFIIEVLNPTFSWIVTDEDGDDCTSDLYLGTNLLYIQGLNPSNKVGEELTTTTFKLTDPLEKGETYYWTVIPHDGTEYGICPEGVWSFTVNESATFNNPPVLEPIADHSIKVGENLTLVVNGQDLDPEDASNLVYSLDSAPEGMEISSNGTITWTPEEGQVGTHTVTVRLSDGKDFTSVTFEIEVKEMDSDDKNSEGSPLLLLSIIIIIVVIVVLLLLLLMLKKKPKENMYSPKGPSGEYNTSMGYQREQSTESMAPQITPQDPPLLTEEEP
ncbi:MAG: FG-GAP repeat protein [Thermoplasmata archaeon]|nr:MAG: FG-GAP repeat protein [Thermoplasmata archaeon]